MAASAQPSANGTSGNGAAAAKSSDCGPATAVSDNSAPTQALKHNPGLAAEWTLEEQSILEDGLVKYASEPGILRFAKIAMLLSEKTVRDVALRSRWMTKRENGKRKKDELNSSSKKSSKKGLSDTAKASQMATRPSIPPYPVLLPMEIDDEVSSNAIGGLTGELFEQNAQCFSQISTNFASYQHGQRGDGSHAAPAHKSQRGARQFHLANWRFHADAVLTTVDQREREKQDANVAPLGKDVLIPLYRSGEGRYMKVKRQEDEEVRR